MVAVPSALLVSSAEVLHCLLKATTWLVQPPPLNAHWSCHNPWSWLFKSTVQAKVSPVKGLTASVPRKTGQVMDPVRPVFVGQFEELNPEPGCALILVQFAPSVDW